jgi:hypothetical protein
VPVAENGHSGLPDDIFFGFERDVADEPASDGHAPEPPPDFPQPRYGGQRMIEAFNNLPDSVKAMVTTTIVTGIEPLFTLGWSDDDIAELIARFTDGIGKPYVGCDQAVVLGNLGQRRAAWQAKKVASNGHATTGAGPQETTCRVRFTVFTAPGQAR